MRSCFTILALTTLAGSMLRAGDLDSMQGDWRPLGVFKAGQPDLLDDENQRGSTFRIHKNRIEWKGRAGKDLWAADFSLSSSTEKGRTIQTIDLVVGKEKLLGLYDLYNPDVLRITYRQANLDKGRPLGHSGNHDHAFLLLERITDRKPRPVDPSRGDQDRLLGTWIMLTSLDDASDKIPAGPFSGHVVVITKDRIEWKPSASGKTVSVGADYKIDPTKTPRQIDFLNTRGGNPAPPADGFLPAIYEFVDEDTLKVCYPESGFKKDVAPQDRPRPTRFFSDGDRNLWIMKRQK
jgi:uncharacterized protein (TIGR03067 family)